MGQALSRPNAEHFPVKTFDHDWRLVPCPGCGRADAAPLFQVRFDPPLQGTGTLVRCRHCRLIWLNPQPTEATLVKAYPSEEYYAYRYVETVCRRRGGFSKVTDRLRRWAIVASSPTALAKKPWWLRGFLWCVTIPARQRFRGLPHREPGRLLDAGCGDGAFGVYLKDAGWTVYGVEFHPAGAARARANGLEVFEGDFTRGEVPWRGMDVVRLWHVLEHLPEPRATLRRAFDLLRPGGELILGVPNMACPHVRVFRSRWVAMQAPQHLVYFTPMTLRRLMDEAGFVDVRMRCASVGTALSSVAALCPKSWGPLMLNYGFRAVSIAADLFFDAVGFGDGLEVRARRPQ